MFNYQHFFVYETLVPNCSLIDSYLVLHCLCYRYLLLLIDEAMKKVNDSDMQNNFNPFEQIDIRLKSIEEALAVIAAKEQPQTEKKFYPVAEAAQKLGVAAITLYRGIESGKIPSKRIGSRVMLPGSFVDK